MITYIIIYIIGFILSIFFLKKFGKQMGYDYSGPHDDKYMYDDYKTNGSAYTSFSFIWPIFYFINIIFGIWMVLRWLVDKVIKD